MSTFSPPEPAETDRAFALDPTRAPTPPAAGYQQVTTRQVAPDRSTAARLSAATPHSRCAAGKGVGEWAPTAAARDRAAEIPGAAASGTEVRRSPAVSGLIGSACAAVWEASAARTARTRRRCRPRRRAPRRTPSGSAPVGLAQHAEPDGRRGRRVVDGQACGHRAVVPSLGRGVAARAGRQALMGVRPAWAANASIGLAFGAAVTSSPNERPRPLLTRPSLISRT